MSTFVWETNSTLINHLRVQSSERDAHSLQLRFSAMLNAAEFRPPALPPAAILIVRRMGRELPPVRLDWRSVRPPPAWQAAASDALATLARRAVRPAHGSSESDGDCVLFLDRSELLACLASDWLDDALRSRWWWRCLFPREDLVEALLRAWAESPQYVPAALERLAKAGRAAPFLLRMQPAQVTALVKSILRVFALPDLERSVDALVFDEIETHLAEPLLDKQVLLAAGVARVCDLRREDESLGDSVDGVAPPPAFWVPEANVPELKKEHRILLIIALMTQRAPQVIRTRAFAAQVSEWAQRAAQAELPLKRFPAFLGLPPAEFPVEATLDNRAIHSSESRESHRGAMVLESNAPGSPPPVSTLHSTVEHAETVSPPATTFRSEFEDVEERAEQQLAREEGANGDEPYPATPTLEMVTPPEFCLALPFDGIEIETEFGGVFYLINQAIYLGFYGDFSTPAEPGIDLAIWDFVALAGLNLIGEVLRDDPVWKLLATLSGRSEREEPGSSFDPQLLSQLMAQMRDRLLLTLELERPDDLGAFLLRHNARVQVTDTHLEVFLSLEELPVPIRIARLDRDPGWVPAAGRHIAFHFV